MTPLILTDCLAQQAQDRCFSVSMSDVDDQLFLIPAHVVRVERRASGAKPKLAWAR